MVVCRLWASSGGVLVIWWGWFGVCGAGTPQCMALCFGGWGGGLLLHLCTLQVALVADGLGVIFLHLRKGWFVLVVAVREVCLLS